MTEIFKCMPEWCPHECRISVGTDPDDPPHRCPYDGSAVKWERVEVELEWRNIDGVGERGFVKKVEL